ncbi:MAG: class I mannose-6-phosphate isomerase [Ruminococcus sp.]|nr:class I mannose-6-phosphate isomerase [Ruminococcus sp.]
MILLSPSFKDYLWGGTKLKDVYNKQCDYSVIAESWELSAHTAGQSVVSSGVYKGLLFSKYLETVGKKAWGWKCSLLKQFPLMIKFIDAKENLSVQVHPDDEYALQNENSYGKNEMWYVINSESDSGLYVGFNQDVTKEQVEESIENHTIMSLLNFYPTKAGDVFFIPAGTVHAIGAGNLVCEIQQSSNCTYRLYDYDRCDTSGNPRELHLKKALDVLSYKKYQKDNTYSDKSDTGRILSQCKYFKSVIYDVDDEQKIKLNDSTFFSLICLKGNGNIELGEMNMNIRAGDSVFIPAVNGELIVSGSTTIILSNI